MLNVRKYFLLGIFAFLMVVTAVSQNNRPMKAKGPKPKIAWKDSIYYGGNIGLQVLLIYLFVTMRILIVTRFMEAGHLYVLNH